MFADNFPDGGPIPRQTGRLTVGSKITLIVTVTLAVAVTVTATATIRSRSAAATNSGVKTQVGISHNLSPASPSPIEQAPAVLPAATQIILLGTISVDFDVTNQLLIRFSAYISYWRKNRSAMRQLISCSSTARKPMIERGVLYSHRVWSTHEISPAWLVEIYLNETYSKDRIGEHYSGSFLTLNGIKRGA
jgi:hypothetical protein